jgi:hypothetical protein
VAEKLDTNETVTLEELKYLALKTLVMELKA